MQTSSWGLGLCGLGWHRRDSGNNRVSTLSFIGAFWFPKGLKDWKVSYSVCWVNGSSLYTKWYYMQEKDAWRGCFLLFQQRIQRDWQCFAISLNCTGLTKKNENLKKQEICHLNDVTMKPWNNVIDHSPLDKQHQIPVQKKKKKKNFRGFVLLKQFLLFSSQWFVHGCHVIS